MRQAAAFVLLLGAATPACALECERQVPLQGSGMVPVYAGSAAGTYRVCRVGNAGPANQSLDIYVNNRASGVLLFTKKSQVQCLEVDGTRIEVKLQGGGNVKDVAASSARCKR